MRYLAFLAVLLLSQPQTFAGFMFTISNPAGNTGDSITRDVFVTALAGDGFSSLTQAEFNLTAGAGATITNFAIDSAMTGNTMFFPQSTATVTGGGTGLAALLYANSAGTTAISNQVKLGQITLALGSAGTATLTFSDPGATVVSQAGNNVNVNATSLQNGFGSVDNQVFRSPQNMVNVSITAVPEPSSILFGAVSILFAFRSRITRFSGRFRSNSV